MKQRFTRKLFFGGTAFVLIFTVWVGCNAPEGESKKPQQTAVVQASPSSPASQPTSPILPDHTKVEETPTTVNTVEPLDLCVDCCSKSDMGMVLGKGIVEDLAYSFDGKWLAVASTIGVRLYDVQGFQETEILAEGISVSRVAFSPDGKLLASGLAHGDVCLWQVADARPIAVLHGNRLKITRLSFSSDGTALLAGSRDGDVLGWQLSDGMPIKSLEKLGVATDAAFSLDGKQVAGGYDRYVRLWSVLDGTLLKTFESPEGQVQDVALAPDGTMLAFAAGEKAVFVWQVTDGTLLNRFETGSYGAVRDLSFSSDGEFLVAGMEGDIDKGVCGTVLLWRMTDGQLVRQFVAPDEYGMTRVALAPNSKWLTASTFSAVHVWHIQDNELGKTLEGYGNINSIVFSRDGKFLASGSGDGIVYLWHIADGNVEVTIHDPSNLLYAVPAYPVAFSPDGKLLALPSKEGSVYLWQVPAGTLSDTLTAGDYGWISSLSYSADGRYLAAGTWQGAVLLWQTTDRMVRVLKEPACENIDQIAFSPDGAVLTAGTLQGMVYSWQTADGSLLNQWQVSPDSETGIEGLAFSPDGTFLASASTRGIQFWSASGDLIGKLSVQGGLKIIVISPDGVLIAGVSSSGVVQLWRLDDKSLVYRRQGDWGSVKSMAFSENGEWLAIATWDGAILVWPTTIPNTAIIQSPVPTATQVSSTFTPSTVVIPPPVSTAIQVSSTSTPTVDTLIEIIYVSDPNLPQYDPKSPEFAEFPNALKQLSSMGAGAVDAASHLAVAITFPRQDSYLAAQTLLALGPDITALAIPVLLDNLRNRKPETRVYSAILLGSAGHTASCAVENIAPLLWDSDPLVRSAAAFAMEKIIEQDLVASQHEIVITPSFLADSISADTPDGAIVEKARQWWNEQGSKINWRPVYGICDP